MLLYSFFFIPLLKKIWRKPEKWPYKREISRCEPFPAFGVGLIVRELSLVDAIYRLLMLMRLRMKSRSANKSAVAVNVLPVVMMSS